MVIGLSYEDYLQAVRYISSREGAQRKILMDRLKLRIVTTS